jgi:hypothetical protein
MFRDLWCRGGEMRFVLCAPPPQQLKKLAGDFPPGCFPVEISDYLLLLRQVIFAHVIPVVGTYVRNRAFQMRAWSPGEWGERCTEEFSKGIHSSGGGGGGHVMFTLSCGNSDLFLAPDHDSNVAVGDE